LKAKGVWQLARLPRPGAFLSIVPALTKGDSCRLSYGGGGFGTKKKAPLTGPFRTTMPGRRRWSGCGGQQLPVLGQDDRVDRVNNAIRSRDIRLHHTGTIDP